MNIDVTPDPEEIVQSEEDALHVTPIAVVTHGPVETRELPAVRAGYKTEPSVGPAVAVRLLPFEPRRKSAVILASGADIWIANSQAAAQLGASSAFLIPNKVAFPVDHLDEVWACATAGTADVSVMSTFWSE